MRKVKEGETTNDLFAFLTTDPNDVVGAVHPKAMPVILRDEGVANPPTARSSRRAVDRERLRGLRAACRVLLPALLHPIIVPAAAEAVVATTHLPFLFEIF